MRYLLISVFTITSIVTPLSCIADDTSDTSATSATNTSAAPADEYFGRAHESVLGIRNRLNAIDNRSDSDMLSRGAAIELDDIQNCILDWQHRYPNDPWLPRMMSRLVKDYARAGEASDPHAMATLQVMLTMYPGTPETQAAVAAIGSESAPATNSVLAAAANDADVAPPTVAAAPVTAPAPAPMPAAPVAQASNDLAASPAWVAFNAQRSADGTSAVAPVQEATIVGDVVDASSGEPVQGAIVLVSPNQETYDVTSTAFSPTSSDGSFSVRHVRLGGPFHAGEVALEHAEYVVVEPPRGSNYATYHGMIDGTIGDVQAGVIRLSTL